MELTVYNGELFERSISRYVIFFTILASIIIISILNNNIIGAIIIIFLIGGYFYYSNAVNKKIKIKIDENGLCIGDKIHLWNNIKGYILEVNKNNGEIKNIVFLLKNNHHIYTIVDDIDKLKIFVGNIDKFINLLPDYQQTFWEKIMRKFEI